MSKITAADIAAALGISKAQVHRRAVNEEWKGEMRPVRGGQQKIFAALDLPRDVRVAICERELGAPPPAPLALPPHVPALVPPAPLPSTSSLTDAQRRTADARLALLREIDRLAHTGSAGTAIDRLCEMALAGGLAPHLAQLVPAANARSGGGRALSPRTVKRWRAAYKAGGFAALAPADARDVAIPTWAPALLRHYRRPQKPALTEALEALRDEGGTPVPTYDQAVRFLRKVGNVERERGRMGPRELKNLKPYTKRDDSKLDPLDVVLMDGHQFDAEVAHPIHGQPFRPEITAVIDAKTRVMLGFSLGLAESAAAVADAIREAVQRFGVPAILYTDRGSGYEADVTSGPAAGLLNRLDITHTQSIAYNSQARGRSERSHQTVWVAGARKLPTFIGSAMDAEAKGKVHKLTRRDLVGRGRALLMPWRDFVEFCRAEVDAYNARPHRGLAKIIDPETGKRRHMSPIEAWRTAIDAGFTPVTITPATADDLFRPHREATTNRGVIRFANLEYFSEALVEFTGERVLVAYEPANAEHVWVKTLEGRLICKAALDGHARDYMPEPMLEQARRQRAKGRLRRLERDADEVRAELLGPALDLVPMNILSPADEAAADELLARFVPAPAPEPVVVSLGARPIFGSDEAKIRWMAENPAAVDADDMAWFRAKRRAVGTAVFEMLYSDFIPAIDGPELKSAAG